MSVKVSLLLKSYVTKETQPLMLAELVFVKNGLKITKTDRFGTSGSSSTTN
jgi:hypothetical protein